MEDYTENPMELLSGPKKFYDPFLLPSSATMPRQAQSAFDLALYLYYLFPEYRQASKRLTSHFITDIDLSSEFGDRKERDTLYDILVDGLNLFGVMGSIGEEYACYGNSFIRVHMPFDRYLIDDRDPNRLWRWAIHTFGDDLTFNLATMTYNAPDPIHPGQRHDFKFVDYLSRDWTRVRLRLLDPRRVILQHSWISGKTRVVYDFEEWFRNDIKKSNKLFQINETPMYMLEAIRDEHCFLFEEGEVFHFKAPTISGISNSGWGMPEVLANYRTLHQLQVYRMVDEVIGKDYLLPFRLFSPPSNSSGEDASHLLMDRSLFKQDVSEMIKRRRSDPYAIHAFADPISYQEFGADQHKSMTPKELVQYQTNNALDSFGYPAELFRGSLQVVQIPTTIRLFENTFRFIHYNFNHLTKWVSKKVCHMRDMSPGVATLQLPSLADDLEKRQIYLQLGAAGELSRSKYLRGYGVADPIEEIKERLLEDIEIERQKLQIQKDFEREVTMGTPEDILAAQTEGGGDPGGNVTPMDRMAEAEEIAMSLLQEGISNGDRQRELKNIKAADPQLHALVKQKMEEVRAAGAAQGRQMANEGQL